MGTQVLNSANSGLLQFHRVLMQAEEAMQEDEDDDADDGDDKEEEPSPPKKPKLSDLTDSYRNRVWLWQTMTICADSCPVH